MQTLLLDTGSWDLLLDSNGNIAVASEPYALAQDAASAARTFYGECFFDTTLGIKYGNILGQRPSVSYLKAQYVAAALTVPDVATAQCYITGINNRELTGQIQVSTASGATAAAEFTAANPQGA